MYQYCKHRFGERFDSPYLHWSNRRTGMLCFCEINKRSFQDKKRLIPSAGYTQFTIHMSAFTFCEGGQQWHSQILVKKAVQ